MRCFQVSGQDAAPKPPPMPAVATHAQQSRYAMDQHPSYTGGATARNAMPAVGEPKPPPQTTAGFPQKTDGCGVCGSGDVQLVLEQDLGIPVDASDPAAVVAPSTTRIIRSPFCSIECLAKRFGLSPDAPNGARVVDGHHLAHTS